mmetsp:Transcript_23970/g.67013  ORF Transcript_23970/g.67013 Transcript_23970/m.67013 type:complete len:333 (-) Transcript_23970:141-1139(-)
MKTNNVCKAATTTMLMGIRKIARQGVTYPFGDHRSVLQAFPAGIPKEDADPFLMCDYFGMKEKQGPVTDPDDFPIDWHPHRGFDIASYLKSGTGRHGDSLGNRETYATPGMQWMSCGSGVVHAEGGANEKGTFVQGFQIWINVPGTKKMDDPRYGTVPSADLPLITLENDGDTADTTARLLAGEAFGKVGPFQTTQDVQMIDFEVPANQATSFDIAVGLDTAMLYVYEGGLDNVNEEGPVDEGQIVLFDATVDDKRAFQIKACEKGGKAMLFAGKKLKEPIAWHGPIVMNNQRQIISTMQELRSGNFPPKRTDWDYKRLSTFPADKQETHLK